MDNQANRKPPLPEDDQQRRYTRNAVIVVAAITIVLLLAFMAGLPQHPPTPVDETTTVTTMAPSTNDSAAVNAIAPASGETAVVTDPGTAVPASDTASTDVTPAPVTTYTSEEDCRTGTGTACKQVDTGWQPIAAVPDRTTVPETIAPPMPSPATASDSSTEED